MLAPTGAAVAASTTAADPIVVIAPGAAIQRRFYRHFAAAVAESRSSRAVVLRWRSYGESDKIATLLTEDAGKLTFTGNGRYFAPINEHFAVQAQGEYLYFRDRKEGQFDLGMVNRIKNFQTGLFGSFKNVQFNEFRNGGTLGQGSVGMERFVAKLKEIGYSGTLNIEREGQSPEQWRNDVGMGAELLRRLIG